jgi:uncharacterized protein
MQGQFLYTYGKIYYSTNGIMKIKNKKPVNPLLVILIVYVICFLFRIIEYLLIRTDQTFFAEASIHKIAGIIVLAVTAEYYTIALKNAGFAVEKMWRHILYGFLLGIPTFIPAYVYGKTGRTLIYL